MADIILLPRTEAGREALRDALRMLRTVGPPPEGQGIDGVDWDRLAIEVERADRAQSEGWK